MFPTTRSRASSHSRVRLHKAIIAANPWAVNPLAVTLVLLLSLTLCTVVSAKPEDSEQPITIEADEATLDEKQGVSTYTGHVLLKQGGIQINASKLTVHSSDSKVDRLVATGTPVIYLQQGEPDKGDIIGEALKMEYFASEGRLVLLDNASLVQERNRFTGNRIVYDTQKEVVSASVSKTGKQRVQVTIQPRKPSHKKNTSQKK